MSDFDIEIWNKKYKAKEDNNIQDTFKRIANFVGDSDVEKSNYFDIMNESLFIPGGRILASAGADGITKSTLSNCYVMGEITDSMAGIMDSLSESALTMKSGGGIGIDFSTIRPEGDLVSSTDCKASGPVSFMQLWDSMCKTVSGYGLRRGAMLGSIRIDHPDILKFIHAKDSNSKETPILSQFNISVSVTDEFMKALKHNSSYELKFNGKVYGELDANSVWKDIISSNYRKAEPGVIFIDTVNRLNNLNYNETINTCNPCLHEDTLVAVPYEVPYMTIKNLYKRIRDGRKVHVYAWEEKSQRFRVAEVSNIILTREKAPCIRVVIGRLYRFGPESYKIYGESIICTPDHKFLLFDGTYKEAQYLTSDDELRVFRRKDSIKNAATRKVKPKLVLEHFYRVDVYDMVVPGFNNFIIHPRSYFSLDRSPYPYGVVVHNCGEQMLPPYGSCNLGSINLTQFVNSPFTSPEINYEKLSTTVEKGVEFLDSVLDKNYYPLDKQLQKSLSSRNIGLGIMGLGSFLAMNNVSYGSDLSLKIVEDIMKFIAEEAYLTSVKLSSKKGSFPDYKVDSFLQSEFLKVLNPAIKKEIKSFGIRNGHLLTIAPTGSIAQLVGNVSSGLEPIFALQYVRTNYGVEYKKRDYAYKVFCSEVGEEYSKSIPYSNSLKTAYEITPEEHLKIMAMCQKYIDASISKTINLPSSITEESMGNIYNMAYYMGCKGCTTYREGSLESILKIDKSEKQLVKKPMDRPYVLLGKTYKVKPPDSRFAYYLTFTYIDGEEVKKPYELFISTKNAGVEEWIKGLSRVTSAVFRNVSDPTFLIEEFKDVHSTLTGFLSPKRQKYVPSLIAEFGEVMEDFFKDIGIIDENNVTKIKGFMLCPKCGSMSLVREEGCDHCTMCEYNKCG